MTEQLSIQLDTSRCRAYGVCLSILPEVFDLPKGSSSAVLLRTDVADDLRDDLEESIRNCPAQAIALRPVAS